MRKAIIVGPQQDYFDFFKDVFPDWDVQHPVYSITQMWDDLESQTLDEESEIVVFIDESHDPNPNGDKDLELAILTLANDAIVLVIADEDYQDSINAKLQNTAAELGYTEIPLFWYLSRDNAVADVELALSQHAQYVNQPYQTAAQPSGTDNSHYYAQTPDTSQAYDQNPYLEQDYVPESHVDVQEDDYDTSFQSYYGDGYTGEERHGMIIASTSSKGGSGKSTVGLCTASMLYHSSRLAYEQGRSERPLDVVIVDMDTRDGQIGFLLGEATPTVLNIFTSQDFSRNNIRQNLVYHQRLGIHALLAPKRARTADYTTPEFYRDLIQKLRTMFDIVILDTSVNYTDPLVYDVILPISDAVLFVTDMSKGAVFGMTRWIAEVTLPLAEGGSAGITKDKIGVVVNKSMANVGFDQVKLVEAAVGVPLLVSVPMDSAAVLAATNGNRLDDIVLKHPNISPAYYKLVTQIVRDSVPIEAPEPYDPENPNPQSKNAHKQPPLTKKRNLFGKREK